MKYLLALLLVSCAQPTPAEDVRNLRLSIELTKLGCYRYTVRPTYYPRDAMVTEACDRLLQKDQP